MSRRDTIRVPADTLVIFEESASRSAPVAANLNTGRSRW